MSDFAAVIGWVVIYAGAASSALGVLAFGTWLVHHLGSKLLFQAYGTEMVFRIARVLRNESLLARYAVPELLPPVRKNSSLTSGVPPSGRG